MAIPRVTTATTEPTGATSIRPWAVSSLPPGAISVYNLSESIEAVAARTGGSRFCRLRESRPAHAEPAPRILGHVTAGARTGRMSA